MHVDWCYRRERWDGSGLDTSNEVEQGEDSDSGAAAGMAPFLKRFWLLFELLGICRLLIGDL